MLSQANHSQADEVCEEILPHRYPFLLVDRVTEIEKGKSIKGFKNVSINEEMFNGHFPNHAVMPGMLILEAMAQISGILGFLTSGKRQSDGYIYLFSIHKFACRAMVGHELAASAEILVAEQVIAQ